MTPAEARRDDAPRQPHAIRRLDETEASEPGPICESGRHFGGDVPADYRLFFGGRLEERLHLCAWCLETAAQNVGG